MNAGDEREVDEVMARRIDAGLGEVLGGERAPDVVAAVLARHAAGDEGPAMSVPAATKWRGLAAVFLFGIATVLAVSWLQRHPDGSNRSEGQGHVEIPCVEVASRAVIQGLAKDLKAVELRNLDDAAVAELVQRCPALEHLRIFASTAWKNGGDGDAVSITDAALPAIGSLHQLRWLELVGTLSVEGRQLRELERLPLLERLELRFFDLDDDALAVLPRLPSLRELSLESNDGWGETTIVAIGNCPGLRRLSLFASRGQQPSAFAALASLRGLEELDLGGINHVFRGYADEATKQRFDIRPSARPQVPGGSIRVESLQPWPRLRRLKLAYCQELEPAVGAFLREKCPGLQFVNLENCSLVDDTTVADLLGIRQLRALRIGDCPRITAISLPRLLAATQLQEVDFGNTPWLTLEQAEQLFATGKQVMCKRKGDETFTGGFAALAAKYSKQEREPMLRQVKIIADLDALPDDITSVEVHGLGDRAAARLQRCAALRQVAFVGDGDDPFTAAGLRTICSLPRLESLALSGCKQLDANAIALIGDATGLQQLTLAGMPGLHDRAMMGLQHLLNLREFNVSDAPFTSMALQALADMRQLRKLWLSGNVEIVPSALDLVPPWVQELHLARCPLLASRVAPLLRDHFADLRVLDVAGNDWVDDEALSTILEIPNLERIDVRDCRSLTPAVFEKLCAARSLVELDATRSPCLTAGLAQQLAQRRPDLRVIRVED